ncbi:hypothetical protein EES41_31370 [Streptomyces sp. ADI95-16]|uniref:DUF6426 family protein n=1 Tax=Streptomyces sp. ADI95-16 TaxID=1522758 RepID=UPI000F430540|nr:DUF6426 family protein [Streptomyces sp. ADI95-16]AYV31238.1 hypothetical protein EES41_31370 [Streptomyces sp. ADI95-16]
MKLRSIATTAVLGAVVFTAVPAVAVPFSAYACGGSTLCQDEDPGDEGGGDDGGGNWGGGDWGGEGGGGEGGGGEGGDGGDWSNDPGDPGNAPSDPGGSGVEIVDGPIGQPIDATLPEVVVTGHATRPSAPANPGIPTTHGGGVSGPGPLVTVHSRGRVWEERGKCYRNQSSSVEAKYSQGVTYTVATQTSSNISATALQLLTAQIGTQLNTTVTETYNTELTLKPGESWAVYVEYQTNVYAITTSDFWGNYSTEFVNVTQPTGVVAGRAC